MATESLAPDAYVTQTNLDGTIADIDEDPDSPDANWADAVDHESDTVAHVSFPTPTGSPTTGADKQEFKIWIKRSRDQSNVSQCRIDLYEGGNLITSGTLTDVNSTSGELKSFTWDAVDLSTADGSGVECYILGDASTGKPATRESVSVGAVEWNVEYSAGQTFYESLDATTTPSSAFTKKTSKSLVASSTPSSSLIKLTKKPLASNTTPSALLVKQTSKSLNGTTTPSAALVKKGFKSLVVTSTPSGALDAVLVAVQSLAATTTPLSALVKLTKKEFLATTTPTIALVKKTSKFLTATTTPSMVIGTVGTFLKSLVSTSTPSAAISKVVTFVKALASTTTPSSIISTVYTAGGAAFSRLKRALLGVLK